MPGAHPAAVQSVAWRHRPDAATCPRATPRRTNRASASSENIRAHRRVGRALDIAAFGTGGGRGVAAQLDLAAEQRIDATIVHHEQDDVSRFRAELQSEAAALERVHRRRAPRSVERSAGAAHHGAAAVAPADADRHLRHRRDHDDALGLLEQFLRDVVGDVEHLLHHGAAVLEAGVFLRLGAEHGRAGPTQSERVR